MNSVWYWLAAIGASSGLAFASYLHTVLAHARRQTSRRVRG
jgi:hypothetical protein